jgi:hypothetical protein
MSHYHYPGANATPGSPALEPGKAVPASQMNHPFYHSPAGQLPPQYRPYSHEMNRQTAMAVPPAFGLGTWFDFSSAGYLKGFLAGAGLTLLLTNTHVQKALVRGSVKIWSTFQGGVEEVKEQFKDVKAEMSQKS